MYTLYFSDFTSLPVPADDHQLIYCFFEKIESSRYLASEAASKISKKLFKKERDFKHIFTTIRTLAGLHTMLEAPMAQQQQLPQHSVEVVGAAPAPAVLARPRPRLPSSSEEPDSDPNDSHKDDPTVSDVSSATGVELAVAKAALVATGGNRDHAILRYAQHIPNTYPVNLLQVQDSNE